MQKYDAIIVGAGIAGLTAAKHLDQYKLNVCLLEKDERPGGRVKTDEKEGFRFDRGFQVLLTAYPAVRKYLNLEALDLRSFEPGARCFNLKQNFVVSDTKRKPWSLPRMALSPVGTFMDKIKLGNLRAEIMAKTNEEIFDAPDITTIDYLRQRGFSDKIIERFWRPFYGGIFLETDLRTSARMFEFVFKMFAQGDAAVPARGIEAIPLQMAKSLKNVDQRYNAEVDRIETGQVTLKDGSQIEAPQIIVATEAQRFFDQVAGRDRWNSTTQYYFAAPKAPFSEKLIALQYREQGLVNNLAVMTQLSKEYAPQGQHLIQVSLQRHPDDHQESVIRRIKDELAVTFGNEVQNWAFLRSYRIEKALPILDQPAYDNEMNETLLRDGLYLAGDHQTNASLNGAMLSGEAAARFLVLNHAT